MRDTQLSGYEEERIKRFALEKRNKKLKRKLDMIKLQLAHADYLIMDGDHTHWTKWESLINRIKEICKEK